MRVRVWAVIAASLLAALPSLAASANEEALWQAAQGGDLARVMQLHQEGVDINARTRYGATALSYACDKGQLEIVRYLVENGAEINIEDDFYQVSPMGWALFNGHADIVVLLLENGATGAEQVLTTGVRQNDPKLVAAALTSSEINQGHVNSALTQAKTNAEATEVVALLENAEVAPAPEVTEA